MKIIVGKEANYIHHYTLYDTMVLLKQIRNKKKYEMY